MAVRYVEFFDQGSKSAVKIMAVRYVEFFDLGSKSAITYLNEFIKDYPFFDVEPIQFAFDNEGMSSILARVKGSQDDLTKLERECPEGGLSGWVM